MNTTPRYINNDGYEVDENGEIAFSLDNDIAYFLDMLDDQKRREYDAEGLIALDETPNVTWEDNEPF
jgi:hypothetical protein